MTDNPAQPQPNKTIDSEVDEILRQFLKDFRQIGPANPLGVAREKLTNLIAQEANKAEQLMGEAILARHSQANGQWEKTESFIRSYQTQKVEDPHNIFKRLTAEKGKA